MVNPGPDEPPRGGEYPPLEDTPPLADPYAPVDYPSDPATAPTYPAPPGYPQTDYPQPGYPQAGYPQPGYQQMGYPPPDYPPPGYQQVGYPQPPAGYPPQYPYGYDPYAPPRPAGTNGKAIGALVTSLVGLVFCGVPSIVGLILGVIAMRETKRTGQEGRGMALAGVIVGALGTALMVLVIIFYAVGIAAVISNRNGY